MYDIKQVFKKKSIETTITHTHRIGAIQIIRDTLGVVVVRDSVTKYHMGEGGG